MGQALRIMYLSWHLLGHHKFRRPGDDKTVEWTLLVFRSETDMLQWSAYYDKTNGRGKATAAVGLCCFHSQVCTIGPWFPCCCVCVPTVACWWHCPDALA